MTYQLSNPQFWNQLINQNFYLLDLHIKVGKQSIRLNGEHLGINSQTMAKLQSLAQMGYSAKISKKMKENAGKIQSLQKSFYSRFTTYADPFRFVHQNDLSKALTAIEDIKEAAKIEHDDLLESYDEEKALFINAIFEILDSAQLPEQQKSEAMVYYSHQYPSRQNFIDNFLKITVNGPVKIQSMITSMEEQTKQAQLDAERKQAELNAMMADAERERIEIELQKEREQLEALRKFHESFSKTLIESIDVAKNRSRNEAFNSIADLMDRFGHCQPGVVTKQIQKSWGNALERLDTLSSFDESLKGSVSQAKEIVDLFIKQFEQNIDFTLIQNKINTFRTSLKNLLQSEHSEGAKRLSSVLVQDSKYTDMIKTLNEIIVHPDQTLNRIEDLKTDYQSLMATFKFRKTELERCYLEARDAVEIKLGLKEPPKQNVFDAVAGF